MLGGEGWRSTCHFHSWSITQNWSHNSNLTAREAGEWREACEIFDDHWLCVILISLNQIKPALSPHLSFFHRIIQKFQASEAPKWGSFIPGCHNFYRAPLGIPCCWALVPRVWLLGCAAPGGPRAFMEVLPTGCWLSIMQPFLHVKAVYTIGTLVFALLPHVVSIIAKSSKLQSGSAFLLS